MGRRLVRVRALISSRSIDRKCRRTIYVLSCCSLSLHGVITENCLYSRDCRLLQSRRLDLMAVRTRNCSVLSNTERYICQPSSTTLPTPMTATSSRKIRYATQRTLKLSGSGTDFALQIYLCDSGGEHLDTTSISKCSHVLSAIHGRHYGRDTHMGEQLGPHFHSEADLLRPYSTLVHQRTKKSARSLVCCKATLPSTLRSSLMARRGISCRF